MIQESGTDKVHASGTGRSQPSMTWTRLLETVRYDGAYPTRERAEQVTVNVLAALGRQLTGDERVDLAAVLPEEAAEVFTAQVPTVEKLTGWSFVKDLAVRTNASPATTRWDTGTVFAVLARLAGPGLLARALAQLPTGYALLFGQAQLTPPRAA